MRGLWCLAAAAMFGAARALRAVGVPRVGVAKRATSRKICAATTLFAKPKGGVLPQRGEKYMSFAKELTSGAGGCALTNCVMTRETMLIIFLFSC